MQLEKQNITLIWITNMQGFDQQTIQDETVIQSTEM